MKRNGNGTMPTPTCFSLPRGIETEVRKGENVDAVSAYHENWNMSTLKLFARVWVLLATHEELKQINDFAPVTDNDRLPT